VDLAILLTALVYELVD